MSDSAWELKGVDPETRQQAVEEAQRLGRLLRPKANGRSASFYTLVARDTVEQDFAQNRQRFLAEQGYSYEILDADEI